MHLDDRVLVCEPDASMSRDDGQGFFAADTRFVSGYRLRLGGTAPVLLSSAGVSSFGARFEFTNPKLKTALGALAADTVHLRLERSLGGTLHEDYDLVNFGPVAIDVTMEVSLECDFGDIFEVKDRAVIRRGTLQSSWDEATRVLTTRYQNDDFVRALQVRVDRADSTPQHANGGISFRLEIPAGRSWHTCLSWEPDTGEPEAAVSRRECHSLVGGDHDLDRARRAWMDTTARFTTSAPGPNAAVRRAVEDLASLRLHVHDALAGGEPGGATDRWVAAAGVPWFTALFGRDSLIVALQTVALSPMFSIGALTALGALQGDGYDDRRDMQPGKILHELRRGELAHFGLIAHTPYYGSHDATALYVLTAAQGWKWHGDRSVLEALRPTVERALAWIDTDGDIDGDGLQEYATRAAHGGYYNQGWKDSGDGIVTEHGGIAELPLALCELQGYVIAAKRAWADVVDEVWGETATAVRLRAEAERLAALVEERFWWEEQGTYYLGLDGRKRPIRTVASNAGHLLWTGAVDPDRGRRVASRLLAPDMWSGWGVRTLSAEHPAYNPFSYHLGSVWPHDNALLAEGMRRYGCDPEAAQVAGGIFDAAERFKERRLPELFAGLQRDPDGFPVPYLGANVPQAWASGAIVHLLSTLVGLRPDARNRTLMVDPALPAWLGDVTVANLEVGGASVDLTIANTPDGGVTVESTPRRGELAVGCGRGAATQDNRTDGETSFGEPRRSITIAHVTESESS